MTEWNPDESRAVIVKPCRVHARDQAAALEGMRFAPRCSMPGCDHYRRVPPGESVIERAAAATRWVASGGFAACDCHSWPAVKRAQLRSRENHPPDAPWFPLGALFPCEQGGR